MAATTSKNSMKVLDPSKGDRTVGWDPSDEGEVQRARELFDELRTKTGHMAYVLEDGRRGRQLTEFDPTAREIIIAPPLRGG